MIGRLDWIGLTAALILPLLGAVFVTLWSTVGGVYVDGSGVSVTVARVLSLVMSVALLALGIALNLMALGLNRADRVLRVALILCAICITALPIAYLA